jgi:hypothetical protein
MHLQGNDGVKNRKKSISIKERRRRQKQRETDKYGHKLYTPEGDLIAKPTKGGYILESK